LINPFKKILKNASDTEKKWERNEQSKTKSRKYENCGVARPKETNLTTCVYYGFTFMNIDKNIKTDK